MTDDLPTVFDSLENASPEIEWFSVISEQDGWEMRENHVRCTELVQVLQGTCYYRLNGIQYIVGAGDLLLVPEGSLRMASDDEVDPASGYIAALRFRAPDGTETPIPIPLISHIVPDDVLLRYYAELHLEWTQRLPGYLLRSRAHVMLILHWYLMHLLFDDTKQRQDPRIDHAVDFLVKNYTQPLRVADLANLEGLNPVYFGTLFHQVTGLPVRAFLNRIRVNNAEALIAGGGYSVEEAAHRCGFDDVFYFSKVFKKLRGYNPSQIRTGFGDRT